MSQSFTVISYSPLIFEIRLCFFAENTINDKISAGIQINQKCTVNIAEVIFFKLWNLYTAEIYVGPALDLKSCSFSINKSCFAECYFKHTGSYLFGNSECSSFNDVSLLKSGFLGSKQCAHPSFFSGSTINSLQDFNISFSAREIVYYANGVKSVKARFVTIGDTYADKPFLTYFNNNKFEFADSVVVRAFNNQYFAMGGANNLITLTNCVFSETIPSVEIGDSSTTFNSCSFSMSQSEFNRLKGNAIVSGQSFITGTVVRFPLVGRCPKVSRQSVNARVWIKCVLWFAFIPLFLNTSI